MKILILTLIMLLFTACSVLMVPVKAVTTVVDVAL
jgi:hypothetical protein